MQHGACSQHKLWLQKPMGTFTCNCFCLCVWWVRGRESTHTQKRLNPMGTCTCNCLCVWWVRGRESTHTRKLNFVTLQLLTALHQAVCILEMSAPSRKKKLAGENGWNAHKHHKTKHGLDYPLVAGFSPVAFRLLEQWSWKGMSAWSLTLLAETCKVLHHLSF